MLNISREEFNNDLDNYYEDLKKVALPKDPTPQNLTKIQRNLDIIRTDAIFDFGRYNGLLVSHELLYKKTKELEYNVIIDNMLKRDPKAKTTEAIVKSGVAAALDVTLYSYDMTLPSIVGELSYRVECLKSVKEIIAGKQESIWVPHGQLKIEAGLTK